VSAAALSVCGGHCVYSCTVCVRWSLCLQLHCLCAVVTVSAAALSVCGGHCVYSCTVCVRWSLCLQLHCLCAVVTVSTAALSVCGGHCVYSCLNALHLSSCSHTSLVCFVSYLQAATTTSQNSIKHCIFVTEVKCVLCEVATEILYIVDINLVFQDDWEAVVLKYATCSKIQTFLSCTCYIWCLWDLCDSQRQK
jgi:hypothetical protein